MGRDEDWLDMAMAVRSAGFDPASLTLRNFVQIAHKVNREKPRTHQDFVEELAGFKAT